MRPPPWCGPSPEPRSCSPWLRATWKNAVAWLKTGTSRASRQASPGWGLRRVGDRDRGDPAAALGELSRYLIADLDPAEAGHVAGHLGGAGDRGGDRVPLPADRDRRAAHGGHRANHEHGCPRPAAGRRSVPTWLLPTRRGRLAVRCGTGRVMHNGCRDHGTGHGPGNDDRGQDARPRPPGPWRPGRPRPAGRQRRGPAWLGFALGGGVTVLAGHLVVGRPKVVRPLPTVGRTDRAGGSLRHRCASLPRVAHRRAIPGCGAPGCTAVTPATLRPCNRRATTGRINLAASGRGGTGARIMFFITYLRRELRRRMRQAVLIALGLALGIGLVVTVTAASAGVKKAQSDVLKNLYGVGTDATVTGKPPPPPNPRSAPSKG